MNAAILEAPTASGLRTTREIAAEAPPRGTVVLWSQAQQARAEELVEMKACETVADARRFVEGEAILQKGGKLPSELSQFVADTRMIIDSLERLRAKRAETARWHAQLRDLKSLAERAERRWMWERNRLDGLGAVADGFAASYLEHVAGNEHAPDDLAFRFTSNHLVNCELVRLLRDEIIPELRRRADAAQAAASDFAKTQPPQ